MESAGLAWRPLERFGRHFLELVVDLFVSFFKKCGSADLMPLSSRSVIFASPGVQVGATGAQKTCRRATLATFGRLGDGRVRSALSELWNPAVTAANQPRIGSRRRAKSI